MSTAGSVARPRIPHEIKVELFSYQENFLPRMTQIVSKVADASVKGNEFDDDPTPWLENVQKFLAGGRAMIVHARLGRTLVGFLVLDPAKGIAPFSWVDQRYRKCGLGERFYSFACINLGRPAPEFTFQKDMLDEYRSVLKSVGRTPTLRNSLYVVPEPGTAAETSGNQGQGLANGSALRTEAAADHSNGQTRLAGSRVVVEDGQWVGYSQHDARRLKLRVGRHLRIVAP